MATGAKVESDGISMPQAQRLDCIYDEEPLEFERDPLNETPKMQAQDPLGEIDIGNGSVKRPTYISANISPDWALDLIGEIKPASSKNQRYILVGIDYFTKWIEEIPLPNVDQEAVINFIQNYIIYMFRIPETITTDQGSVFTGRKMQEFAQDF
ncbi:protein NYNRIN [Trifolium repens]|nr:protein NYNRIN [Trifolium repens]